MSTKTTDPPAEDRPTVFISYSRKDKRWLDELRAMLAPLVGNEVVDVWWDGEIRPSQSWREEIDRALAATRIGVLLVSPSFLASDFIAQKELPYLLDAARQRKVTLFWVLWSDCLHEQTPLHEIQAAHEIARPLDSLRKSGRTTVLKKICRKIADAAAREAPNGGAGIKPGVSTPGGQAPQTTPSPERAQALPRGGSPAGLGGGMPASLRDSGDGGGGVLGDGHGRPGVETPGFTPASLRDFAPRLDLGRLPIAGPLLIGRDTELARLDAAWEDPGIHVLTFVAFGGTGKSALVSHWLDRMSAAGWRGARRVLDWSFYSQGTEERVTSADPFLDHALAWFGDPNPKAGAPRDRGLRLAELVRKEKTLLVLDGVEPLQHPPSHPLAGRLKDPGLAALLKGLAGANPGLCVVTTRLRIKDLDSSGRTAPQENLETLTPGAGAELLQAFGVHGKKSDLLAASEEFGNHALALTLLGTYLKDICEGDVRRRREVPLLEVEADETGHARRVIASYEKVLEPPEVEVLRLLGLFDRPAEPARLKALRAEPPIQGHTETIGASQETRFRKAVARLRKARLLAEGGEDLDAHPLVRVFFQEDLETHRSEAWKAGNLRLYEHLQKEAPDLPDTLEAMEPLYTAVIHGCRAGRQQEAFREVYRRRIRRGDEAYNIKKLGAFGSDLSALSGFFDRPWDQPSANLTSANQAFLLNAAGFRLRALGRLAEAVQPMEAGLRQYEGQENWEFAAITASNLSELTLTLGEVDRAVSFGKQSVDLADRSGEAFQRVTKRVRLADALHQSGRWEESAVAFREAEALQAEWQPEYPRLYSLRGYRYGDLLLSHGEPESGSVLDGLAADSEAARRLREACGKVQERAEQTLEWVTPMNWLLDIALDHLSLGRAHLGLTLTSPGPESDFAKTVEHLDHAVEGLRRAAQEQFLPLGLLARAALRRLLGDLTGAEADLSEALEIAERGSMRLFECDAHLEWARLCRLRGDRDGLERHVARARELVEETGYGRRRREVDYLESLPR